MSDSQKKYILAIDHGTGGPKTAIVSVKGEVVDWAFEEVPLFVSKGGVAEQNPDDWWNAILNTSKKVIDNGKVSVDDIVGVCNTSQWSGTVAVDKDEHHLMNSIIWMDSRGSKYISQLYKSLFKVAGYPILKILKLLRLTGGAPPYHGKDPIAHILWIKNERPDIYEKTFMFLEPQDYVNLKLTGNFAVSNVSIHLHWLTDIRDINNIRYSKKLVKMFKVDPKKFPPDIKNSTDILGQIKKEVADKLGLNKDTKVVMGAPDVPSANIGSGAIRDYDGHIYIGTSDWIGCHVPFKKTDIIHNMASIPSAIPGRYILGNEQNIAGGALSFLRDKILYHKDELLKEEAVPDVYKIFDRIVETVPAGSNNLIFTPWLIGERAPVDDHTIRGGLYNISLEMSREHLIRAIFEGVAYNVAWLFKYVEKFIQKWKMKANPGMTKKDIVMPEINIIGGGAQSKVWCQIFADVLNRRIKQVKDPIQANARGAAFIASVGLGYINWDDIPKYIEISNTFTPNPENRRIYDKLFKEYLNIYKITGKTYNRLNK
ncbi:MAG: FGGY-family carbohydrate kinase [Candidatus Lokiarchaeota archaeon]|nr:FGGY-family carbohydrate kinase [Candidatus Lokiarchaeota archaeon]